MLVHAVAGNCAGDPPCWPCTYGYATTIRRAQGSTLAKGALYFDHSYPPDRGYGYVGASRFTDPDLLFHYGPLRVTDWLPVTEEEGQQLQRGSQYWSVPTDSRASEPDDYESGDEFRNPAAECFGALRAEREAAVLQEALYEDSMSAVAVVVEGEEVDYKELLGYSLRGAASDPDLGQSYGWLPSESEACGSVAREGDEEAVAALQADIDALEAPAESLLDAFL